MDNTERVQQWMSDNADKHNPHELNPALWIDDFCWIAELCVAISGSRGFARVDFETNYMHRVMYVITEVDETVEAMEESNAPLIGEELADIAIRLLDIIHPNRGGSWAPRKQKRLPTSSCFREPWSIMGPITRCVSRAAECYRKNDKGDSVLWLEFALQETEAVAVLLGYSLFSEIRRKCLKNASRPRFNGKARAEG